MKMPEELKANLALVETARHLRIERTQHEATKSTLDQAWVEQHEVRKVLARYFSSFDRQHGDSILEDVKRLVLCAEAATDMHEDARVLLDGALIERDKLHQTITAAPHAPHCSSLIPVPDPPRYPCDCWKKEVAQ